jgi:predicted nucleic acid-binding protein
LNGNHRAVFVDTSAYYALIDKADFNHDVAAYIWSDLRRKRQPIVTTNFVISEFHAMTVKRHGSQAALSAIDNIYRGENPVIRITEDDEREAFNLLRQYVDKRYSLVDAMSFVVMQRRGISTAFTFDRHFVQHGFEVVGVQG